VKELATLHDRHLNRPTLDDNVQEEHSIEIMTQDITQVCYVFTFKYTLSITSGRIPGILNINITWTAK
jgi:hypothetical protein